MNTKIFQFMLCVFLSLSVALLSGCGRMPGVTDEMVTPSDETTMPTLKVGLIHPQPNYTSFGKGAELAQAEINAAGGILNMQVELSFREETTDTVVQSATELAEMEGVVAILGPLFSSHAVKVGPVINIPVLLGATRAEVTADATDPNDLMFLIAGSNVLQAELLAQVVVNQLDKKTAAMIWQNMDVYSEGFVQSFKASFEKLGGSVVVEKTYESGAMMFTEQLTAVKDAAPDVLLLASFPPANPYIMKQARDMGIESTFIGSDGWDDPLMSTTLADNESVDGYYCTNLDPDAVAFNAAYTAKYGSVDGIAAAGYDAMRILKMAIEAVGSTDDPAAIRDAIAAITDYEGATSISHFDANRNPVKSVGVRQILNGMPQDMIIEATPEITMDTTNIAETLTETKADPPPQTDDQPDGTGTAGDEPDANNSPDETQPSDPPPQTDDQPGGTAASTGKPDANNNSDETQPSDPPSQTDDQPGGTAGDEPDANNNSDETQPSDPPPQTDDQSGGTADDVPDANNNPVTPSSDPPPPPPQTTNPPSTVSYPTPDAIYYDDPGEWSVTIYYPHNYAGPSEENNYGFTISTKGTIDNESVKVSDSSVQFRVTPTGQRLTLTVMWDPGNWEDEQPPSPSHILQARPPDKDKRIIQIVQQGKEN